MEKSLEKSIAPTRKSKDNENLLEKSFWGLPNARLLHLMD